MRDVNYKRKFCIKLRHAVLQCLERPTQHVNLVSAFNNKSTRIKKQALL